jgi:hypothetical protein
MEFGVLCYILPSLLRFPGRVTMPFLYCLPHVGSSGMICGGNDNSQYIKHTVITSVEYFSAFSLQSCSRRETDRV